jgi:death-on-curing protein
VNEAWIWLSSDVLLAVHDEQLVEHGGAAGVRDLGLFESALSRPRNLVSCGSPDVCERAAAYGYGLSRNHPFIDGNKRTAFVAVELFLVLNGRELLADDANCVLTMLAVAAGTMTESTFAQWLRDHTQVRR